MARTFKKLLPFQEAPPGAASLFRLWVDNSYIIKIKHGMLDTAASFGAFVFTLASTDATGKQGKLGQLIEAESKNQSGQFEPVSKGDFLWINSGHVFAIGSYMPPNSNISHTVLWTIPSAGEVILEQQSALHVLVPVDDASNNPFSWSADSKPMTVARVLEIELENPA